jgi:hypothetical protein
MKNKNLNISLPNNTNNTVKNCKSERSCPKIMLHELDLEIGDLVIDVFRLTTVESKLSPMLLVEFHGENTCLNSCMLEDIFGKNDESEDTIDPDYFEDNRVILIDSSLGIIDWPISQISKYID